jgi:hypothetical protein
MANISDYLAIDPLALILTNEAYVRLTLPDPPPIDVLVKQMRQVAGQLKADEKKVILARARMLGAYANAMERALTTTK